MQTAAHFVTYCNIHFLTCLGRPKRGGDHPDHSAFAQGAPPLPAPQTEERGGVSAAREGAIELSVSTLWKYIIYFII